MSRRSLGAFLAAIITISTASVIVLMSAVPKRDGLDMVRLWAYQIQNIEADDAVDALIDSKYDLLVIEPTRSSRELADFDMHSVVDRLHRSTGTNVASKIVIAYVDIGQAEDWRWYWEDNWTAPTEASRGSPDFLIALDPDGWSGNYPVAFWDQHWKEIILYSEGSSIQQIIDDGFDGIYMDWIGGFNYKPVVNAAESEGLDAQQEMIDFITEIREYCQKQNPDFILIAQNALDICENHSEYFDIIDGVAQEHVLFDGAADAEWGDSAGGDMRVPESDTEWYVEMLDEYLNRGKVVFTVDYALREENIAEAYSFAQEHGYIEFVSHISLSQLPAFIQPDYSVLPIYATCTYPREDETC